jgi:hypothetical protein
MMNAGQNIEAIVQRNLESYNRRDIDAFMETFTSDIELYTLGEHKPAISGRQAMRNFYEKLFEASPKLHSAVLKRIVLGNKVIDHESIAGRLEATEPVEIVVVYEIRDEKIFRLTAIRK